MRALTYLRWMMRDSRGARGRMLYFTICLAVGVAAVVGTAALSAGIERGFEIQSREILGADFTVDSRRPLPAELDPILADVEGLERSDTIETMSMVAALDAKPGAATSQLARLFVVTGRYPLYGEVATEPPGGLSRHLSADTIVPEAEVLHALGLEPGDTLRVGGKDFRIAAAATSGPGQLGFSSFLAPRVYLAREGFAATGLLAFGSRVRYSALFAVPGNPTRQELEDLTERLKASTPDAAYLDFDTHHEVGRGRRAVRRVEGFVGLVALLSLVVGGIGVALIVRTWLAGRTAAIAVMRCLGLRPAQILALSLGHTMLLALAGSLVGAALGCVLPYAVRAWAPDLLPVDVAAVFPTAAVLRGVGLGVGLSLAFSLPPLAAIWRVAPARVLRADAEPLPPNRPASAAAAALLIVGVFAAAWVQSGVPLHAAWFTGGFIALTTALFLGARALIWIAGRIPRRRLSPYLVHGVSALARPGAGTTGAVVALGLGTMVVTGMWLVESRLREAILAQIPENAPSVFLVDIQPEQRSGVEAELERAGAENVDQVPVVMARISRVDGRSVEELSSEDGRSRRWLTREQRLTWRETLTPDNRITAGALWSAPDLPEVSVEAGFARGLGVTVGSQIEFDVQGVALTLHVTSLRSVEWQSFAINFFLVVEPGVLDGAPALYLLNARVPPESEQPLQDRLATDFGNVTVLRVGTILDQVLELIRRIAEGLRVLGSFTVVAGLAILAGAVSATVLRRGREVALLKTLGVTRAGITALFFTEYGLCGALAGAVGAGGALLLAWAYLEHVAELDVSLPLLALPVATIGCGILTAVCGVVASARALTVRPHVVLR